MYKKLTLITALSTSFCFSAYAVEADITVTADVDSSVSITQSNGSAMPDSISMVYKAGVGLGNYTDNVKLWSNSKTAALDVRLSSAATLTNINDSSNIVPLTVTLNGNTLSTTATEFTAATLFPSGTISSGSITMPLTFSQTTAGELESGTYTGVVSITVSQVTSS